MSDATKGVYQENVGNWMRDERVTLNLSQVELAKLLDVSDSTISNWERAQASMSAEAHARISYIFKRRRRDLNLTERATL